MFSKEREAKVKKLDAILSKISSSTIPASQSFSEIGGSQDELYEMIPEDQIKIEVVDDNDDTDTYIRPTRLISRTGLEHFPCSSYEQESFHNSVVVLNSSPDFINQWSHMPMNVDLFSDGALIDTSAFGTRSIPVYHGPFSNNAEQHFYDEDCGYASLNVTEGNSVEARRTALDAYLYHENDQIDHDSALPYDYGIQDTFVVVHPSESVGIICSICNRTFGTKKSLKRHYKYVHKVKPQAKSFGKNKRRTDETDRSETGDGSLANGNSASSNANSQLKVETEKKGKIVEKLSKQKKSLSPLSQGMKTKTSKNELKLDKKQKQLQGDSKKIGLETKIAKNSIKSYKENENIKKSNEAKKKFVGKNQKVLTGKKIVLAKNKSSSPDSKSTNKPSKLENGVKLSKKKSELVGSKDAEQKRNDIRPKLEKIGVAVNKGRPAIQKRKDLPEIGRKVKPMKNVDSKVNSLKVEAKKNGKQVNKLQPKESKGAAVRKEQEETMPFKCDECGEGFRNMFNLKKHLPLHSIIKYHCYRCEDVFMNMRSLTKHLLIHEDEVAVQDRLHRCRICSQGFKTTRMLRGHMLEHERVEGLESSLATNKSKSTPYGSSHTVVKASQKKEAIQPSISSSMQVSKELNFTEKQESTLGNVEKIIEEGISEKVINNESFSTKQCNESKENIPSCFSCQLSFHNYAQFKAHVIENHINLGDLSLQCNKCTEILTSEREVSSHLVQEHNMTYEEARLLVCQKEREAVFCGSRAKMPVTVRRLSCDTPVVSDIAEAFHDVKVCTEQIDFPAAVCNEKSDSTSFYSGESVDVVKERAGVIDGSQQFAEVERHEQNRNCSGNDEVNNESQKSSCDSLCVIERCDVNNEKEGNFSQGQSRDDENNDEAYMDVVSSEGHIAETYDESCDYSKSFANEKSYFLQEQESRDILQALFIEVEGENSDVITQDFSKGIEDQAFHNNIKSDDKDSNEHVREKAIAEINNGVDKNHVTVEPIKRGKPSLRGKKSYIGEDNCNHSSESNLMKSKTVQPAGNENRFARHLIDLPCVDSQNDDVARFWKNNESEKSFEFMHIKANPTKRDEGNREGTKAHDGKIGVPARCQRAVRNTMNTDLLTTEKDIFIPFVRRKASISGERRILEAINAGRKKVYNSTKKNIVCENNLSPNGYLTFDAGNDSFVSGSSKRRREKLETKDPRGHGANSGCSSVKGKRRKPIQDLENGYKNDEKGWHSSSATLKHNEKIKAVKPSKRRKRRWMFGKISRHTNRKRIVNSESKRNCEESVFEQINNLSLVLPEDNSHDFPLSKSNVELGGSHAPSCEVYNSNETAHKTDDFQVGTNSVDVNSNTTKESTITDRENSDTGGGTSSQGKDAESIHHVDYLRGNDSDSSKKIHESNFTSKSPSESINISVAPKEATQLASLIYVPRRAAVAGQGKMQEANRKRKIDGRNDRNIEETQQRSTGVSVPLMFDSGKSVARKTNAKTPRPGSKSRFTNLKGMKTPKTNSRLKSVPIEDKILGVKKNALCECCSSVSCVKFDNGRSRLKGSATIASNRKKKPVDTNDENKKLICNSCGKRFNTMYFLRLHENRHFADGHVPKVQTSRNRRTVGFRCKVCAVTLPSKATLADHLKTCHSGGKHQGLSSNKLKSKRGGLQGQALKSSKR